MRSIHRLRTALVSHPRMRARTLLLVATALVACLGLLVAEALGAGPDATPGAAERSLDGGTAAAAGKGDGHRARASEKAFEQARAARRDAQRHELLEELELTDAQQRAIDALPERQAAWQEEHRARLHEIRDRLLIARADGDLQTVKQLTEEQQRIIATRPVLGDILTPEQKQRLREGRAGKRAGAGEAGRPGAAGAPRKTPVQSPELQALQAQIREARLAGDVERVKELQTQVRMIRQAVRDARAAERERAGGPTP